MYSVHVGSIRCCLKVHVHDNIMCVYSGFTFHLYIQVTYESDHTYTVYKQEGFYHHTNQLDKVYRTLVDPLVNIFRPYFVFVTYDM